MQRLEDLTQAHSKVLADIGECLASIRRITSTPCETAAEGIAVLNRIRLEVYEDINQIQHEHLIVRAAEWLRSNGLVDEKASWLWNPRQSGGSLEPDLQATLQSRVLVSAEITTSARPVGVIDTRMASTLSKLAGMQGRLYYFVCTPAMANRAETKIRKAGWDITVVNLAPRCVAQLGVAANGDT